MRFRQIKFLPNLMFTARSRPDICPFRAGGDGPATVNIARCYARSFRPGEKICWPGRWYSHRFQSCATLTPFPHPLLEPTYSIIRAPSFSTPAGRASRLSLFRDFRFSSFLFASLCLVFSPLSFFRFFNAHTYTSRARDKGRAFIGRHYERDSLLSKWWSGPPSQTDSSAVRIISLPGL